MKDLVFNYNLKRKGPYKVYGTSVTHSVVEHTLKPEVREQFPNSPTDPWDGFVMDSEIALVDKFKSLVRSRTLPKAVAEELMNLIEVYGDDRATKAVDDESLSNSEDL